MKRQAVGQANETSWEKYLRGLNQTSGQVNEALDGIKIEGLDALNEGLVDAIMGAKSLGAVFHQVANQILADLMKLIIRQTIIKALASIAGGIGGGGGTYGVTPNTTAFAGYNFGGGRASGGPVSPGSFYTVNERSTAPGLFIPMSPGVIQPPGGSRIANDNGAPTVQVHIANDFRGADPAAVAAINARVDRMQRELPGTIVTTVQDAKSRFIIR
jgi:hypothetical protein